MFYKCEFKLLTISKIHYYWCDFEKQKIDEKNWRKNITKSLSKTCEQTKM